MALSYKFEVQDGSTRPLQHTLAALEPERVNPVLARAVSNQTRRHLFARDSTHANTMGGKRTHFYGDCARSTLSGVEPDGFFVSINQVGFRQRLEGGTIQMQNKLLTIPARSEAYGRRATEFNNLRFVMFRSGTKALMTSNRPSGYARSSKTGVKLKKAARMPGLIMFWLVPSVTQKPDPGVLPTEQDYNATLTATFDDYKARIERRAGGAE